MPPPPDGRPRPPPARVLEAELQLVRVELLRAPAELAALQLLDQRAELVELDILALERAAWAARPASSRTAWCRSAGSEGSLAKSICMTEIAMRVALPPGTAHDHNFDYIAWAGQSREQHRTPPIQPFDQHRELGAVSVIAPSLTVGQTKLPRSTRLANRHMPLPSHHTAFNRSPRAAEQEQLPAERILPQRLLDLGRQTVKPLRMSTGARAK